MWSRRPERRRRAGAGSRFAVEVLEGRQLLSTITEYPLTQGSSPQVITSGPDGALWFTQTGSDKIGRMTPGGALTEFDLSPGSAVIGIAAGSDGNLWFAEYNTDKIGRITTGGTITEFDLTPGSHPLWVTTGPDGALWFTQTGNDRIGRITTAGVVTEYSLTPGSTPWMIAPGPDGNVWYTAMNSDRVGSLVPSGPGAGTITEYPLTTGTHPRGIVTGPDGNLWVVGSDSNTIIRVTPTGTTTEFAIPNGGSPNDIVVGPMNALYFAPFLNDEIVSVTTSGAFTTYGGLMSVSRPGGITLGPDNHIWFTEQNTHAIGRLNLGPIGADDTYNIIAGHTLSRNAAQGILANDIDPENDPLQPTLVSPPLHGQLTLNPDGSFTYVPTTGYVGPDSFTYQASDGQEATAVVTASILVLPNQPPVGNADAYATVEGTPLTVAAPGVLGNDIDADADPLTAELVSGPSRGHLTLAADGSFTYTPDTFYAGSDSFTYRPTDGITPGQPTTVQLTITPLDRILRIALGASSTASSYGSTVTYTATVRLEPPGASPPSGSVMFYDGGTWLGTQALVNGVATFSTASMGVGAHQITVSYVGSGQTAQAVSTAQPLEVAQATTAVDITTVLVPNAMCRTDVRTMVSGSGVGVPTGHVLLEFGRRLRRLIPLVNGGASLTVPTLRVRGLTIRATYMGDAEYLTSTTSKTAWSRSRRTLV